MYKELRDTWAEMTAPGQMFEITEAEVGGQRVKAWAMAAPSLRDIWMMSAAHGEADYLVYQDERWTYNQAHEEVARRLQSKMKRIEKTVHQRAEAGDPPHDVVEIMQNFPPLMHQGKRAEAESILDQALVLLFPDTQTGKDDR